MRSSPELIRIYILLGAVQNKRFWTNTEFLHFQGPSQSWRWQGWWLSHWCWTRTARRRPPCRTRKQCSSRRRWSPAPGQCSASLWPLGRRMAPAQSHLAWQSQTSLRLGSKCILCFIQILNPEFLEKWQTVYLLKTHQHNSILWFCNGIRDKNRLFDSIFSKI